MKGKRSNSPIAGIPHAPRLRYHSAMATAKRIPSQPPEPTSQDLVRLKQGAITAEQYFEARIEQALAGIRQLVTPDELEIVRETLRASWSHDLAIQRRMQALTGEGPPEEVP